MTMPSTSTLSLENRWASIKAITGRIKNECNKFIAAANLNRKEVLDFANFLADSLDNLAVYTQNAVAIGLESYARQQENNPTLDVIAEYQAMITAINSTQSWLTTNIPNGTATYNWDANSRFANIALTTPQRNAFQAQCTSLSATIA